jgi:hypothetical protein
MSSWRPAQQPVGLGIETADCICRLADLSGRARQAAQAPWINARIATLPFVESSSRLRSRQGEAKRDLGDLPQGPPRPPPGLLIVPRSDGMCTRVMPDANGPRHLLVSFRAPRQAQTETEPGPGFVPVPSVDDGPQLALSPPPGLM